MKVVQLFPLMILGTAALSLSQRYLGQDTFNAEADGKCNKIGDQQQTDNYKHLTFIHIPRTGGTAVEECTKDDPHEKWGALNPETHGMYDLWFLHAERYNGCNKQHVPPSLWHEGESPYDGKETFCITRNPYTRILSQFKFELAFFSYPSECSAKQFNELIKWRMNDAVQNGTLWQADCHYMPQSFFVYEVVQDGEVAHKSLTLNLEKRVCKHVLNYENLHKPLHELMQAHNYPFQLSKEGGSGMTMSKDCNLTPADMDEESRQLVQKVYADDFKLFGYEK